MAAEFLKVLNFKDKGEDVDVKLAKVNTIDNTQIKTQLAEVFLQCTVFRKASILSGSGFNKFLTSLNFFCENATD